MSISKSSAGLSPTGTNLSSVAQPKPAVDVAHWLADVDKIGAVINLCRSTLAKMVVENFCTPGAIAETTDGELANRKHEMHYLIVTALEHLEDIENGVDLAHGRIDDITTGHYVLTRGEPQPGGGEPVLALAANS